MNPLERAIHTKLVQHPRAKRLVQELYQGLGALVPVKDRLPEEPLVVRSGFFFGFHDLCPWSSDGTRLLAHRSGHIPVREPQPEDEVTIGYFEGEQEVGFVPLAVTAAFNWQEGSRLQWVGAGDQLIYNVLEGGKAHARRLDAKGCVVADYDVPVSSVSPDGRCAASYSFERVRRYDLAYSYAGLSGAHADEAPSDEGLILLDLASGQTKVLCSVRKLAQQEPHPTMSGAYHYVSHCRFSPDSQRISLMHCWLVGPRRYSRLFAYDLVAGELFAFPTSDWVSHHCWMSAGRVLAYAHTERLGRHYHVWEYGSGHSEVVGLGTLTSDGHPQVDPEQRWLLTDSYPDRFRQQHLILYDLKQQRRHDLLSLRIPTRYRYGLRCDFHPRWNRRYDTVCFDSAHTGVRSLCTFAKNCED